MNKILNRIRNDSILVFQFAIDDFKKKYAGSLLGFIWAFVQPVVTVVIYWFIFQVGFKNEDVGGYPFILWLVSGILPWFFVSDAISNSTSCLVEYSYLVKKVVFNVNILPLVRIVSTLLVQIFLLIVTAGLFALYGFTPSVYWLQIIYYMLYMFVLCAGLVYFTAALYVFFRDLLQIVSIVLQIAFWTTPIVWQASIFSEDILSVLSHNPLFYPARGYRDALIEQRWFWEYDLGETLYFWIIGIVFCAMGIFVFRTLRNHFADVL